MLCGGQCTCLEVSFDLIAKNLINCAVSLLCDGELKS